MPSAASRSRPHSGSGRTSGHARLDGGQYERALPFDEWLAGRLKERILRDVIPVLARGLLQGRGTRRRGATPPSARALRHAYDTACTLLYRLLFVFHAEARALLPLGNPAYQEVSLERIKREVAARAGPDPSGLSRRLASFSETSTALHDRLLRLFTAIDRGDSTRNLAPHDVALSRTPIATAPGARPRRAVNAHRDQKIPDRHWTLAIDRLARDRDRTTRKLAFLDYASLPVRHFGDLHESLLQLALRIAPDDLATNSSNGVGTGVPRSKIDARRARRGVSTLVGLKGRLYLSHEKAGRKATGSYYTPAPIVAYIVEHTLGPVLDARLATLRPAFAAADTAAELSALLAQLFDFKVLDPAMGSGHFLVAAADFVTDRLRAFLNRFSQNPLRFALRHERQTLLHDLAESGITIDAARLTDTNLLRRLVLKHCIHGVDLDPTAVNLTRLALWLHAAALGSPLSFLDRNLRCGNSLLGEVANQLHTEAGGFDAIIGNPPYAGHKGDVDARPLRRNFKVCRRYPNPATAFLETALRLLRPGGRYGMIVPKSVQYVDCWQDARNLITATHRLDRLADASRAFDGVRLEQTICIGARDAPADAYLAQVLSADGASRPRRVPLVLCRGVDALPAAVEPRSLRLFERIRRLGPRLGEVSRTSQALGIQARLNTDVTGSQLPIYRGRHIRPLAIAPPEDTIDSSFLMDRRGVAYTDKVNGMLRPKVVSQNIVAHVTRPKPRIWIISAPDERGILCLNTVSTTILTDDRMSIWFVSLVLNSSLACWFYSEFAFCRAIRTMHFDDYYAGKLPLAVASPARAAVDRARRAPSRAARQRAIDEFVFDAYALTDRERRFVHEYCYGVDHVPDSLDATGARP